MPRPIEKPNILTGHCVTSTRLRSTIASIALSPRLGKRAA